MNPAWVTFFAVLVGFIFLCTAILTMLSYFRFGQTQRAIVAADMPIQRILGQALIAELAALVILICLGQWSEVRGARAAVKEREQAVNALLTRVDFLNGSLLRVWRGADGSANARLLATWMKDNQFETVALVDFLHLGEYKAARERAVGELGIRPKVTILSNSDNLGGVATSLSRSGYKVTNEATPAGTSAIRVFGENKEQ
jgi:hypothetical protein